MPIRFAQIEPTTRCNYTCGFCAGRKMRQGDMPWEAFERFLADDPALEHVELQGEGEPLMHPRFFDMVAALRARGVRVSLITNGSLLTANLERLLEAGIESIDVSMESSDAAVFQDIRGGKLSKVIEGLRALVTRRRELGRDRPTVGLAVTVLRRTIGALEGIVALYRELGLDGGIGVQPLQRMSGYTENYDGAMLTQIVPEPEWRAYLASLPSRLAPARRTGTGKRFYDDLFDRWHASYATCPWLDAGAYFTIDGEIRACAFHKHSTDALGTATAGGETPGKRALLAETLRRGTVPGPCAGCGIAAAVVDGVRETRRLYSP